MPTTTNFGWTTPADTDLVKDGASAIRTLGNGVDTTLKNLNPETTLGDLAYRSATSNTNTRLPIGTTGQVLTVSGGVPTWSAPAGGGKVLQVVSVNYATQTTLHNVDWTDTGLSASITPTASNSKILVIVTQPLYIYLSSSYAGVGVRLRRGTTTISGGQNNYINHYIGLSSNSNTLELSTSYAIHYYDSPATTSSTTYKTQVKSNNNATNCVAQLNAGTAPMDANITLLEIGA